MEFSSNYVFKMIIGLRGGVAYVSI